MSPPTHPIQVRPSLGRIRRLAQHLVVKDNVGVTGDDEVSIDRSRLRERVQANKLFRIPTGQLLDARNDNLELKPQLLQDLPPLRRPGCKRDPQDSSGNQIPISRSADSSESEPWTMLKVTSRAKSPRIEPGAASTGLVAPIS